MDNLLEGGEFAGSYLSYSDVLYKHTEEGDYSVCVLPWGSFEPHGLHLPYLTDGLLASMVSVLSVDKTNELKYKFCILPCINMGAQNIGQTNKKFCIHFNTVTQFNILNDIVHSLFKQGIKKLVIINGHNGNNFKTMVRDIEIAYDGLFKIFVCNYLDIIEENKKNFYSVINFPEYDDHAGFIETSLMLSYLPYFVKKEYIYSQQEVKENTKIKGMWTPRNWDEVSTFTCVGDPSTASSEVGDMLMEYVTHIISKSLIEIYKMGD